MTRTTPAEALALLLSYADYNRDACAITTTVGQAIPGEVLEICRDAVATAERQNETIRQLVLLDFPVVPAPRQRLSIAGRARWVLRNIFRRKTP
jgi:hypothetical protein